MPYRVTYDPKGPFKAVSIPSTDPSVVLGRGESAVISNEDADSLRRAFDSGALPGVEEYVEIEKIAEASDEEPEGDDPDDGADEDDSAPEGDETESSDEGDTESLDDDVVDLLSGAGFDSPEKIAEASDEELLAIKGIGQATLDKKIRKVYPKA